MKYTWKRWTVPNCAQVPQLETKKKNRKEKQLKLEKKKKTLN